MHMLRTNRYNSHESGNSNYVYLKRKPQQKFSTMIMKRGEVTVHVGGSGGHNGKEFTNGLLKTIKRDIQLTLINKLKVLYTLVTAYICAK